MGHIINPLRFRLGNSVFWANNWPALEKNKYLLSYEIHQEMDQYFRSLLFYFRKLKLKRRRKTGKKTLRKNRFPKLYFSNVNVNFFGLNLDKVMIDVNLYDFFLDNYIETALSPQSTATTPILPGLSTFLKKFNQYVGFEFFFKHKRILQRLTKQQFTGIIKKCREKVQILEQIAINKLQIFIEIYIEFIRRSLFSVYNDKNNLFNNSKTIFNKEKRLLFRLSYSKRKRLIYRYWKMKYEIFSDTKATLINFNQYFTSEFYSIVTNREHQKTASERQNRIETVTKAYQREKKAYDKQLILRTNLISPIFSPRIVQKFERYLKKTNTMLQNPGILNLNDPAYSTYPKEKASARHELKYLKHFKVFKQKLAKKAEKAKNPENPEKKQLDLKMRIIESHFCDFVKQFLISNNLTILRYLHKWFCLNPHGNLIVLIELIIKDFKQIKDIANLNQEKLIRRILGEDLNYNLKTFLEIFKDIIPEQFYNVFSLFYKNILKFKALNYQYIKQAVKNSATYWLKYTMDPFYQKYMEYKKLKDLYINVNIGIGPVHDTDHDIIDAKFLTLYIKRLFKQRRFKVENLQRTMYRSLSRLPYIEGFVIIFAGRFTRRESKIYKVSKKGILHFGAISKLIDYHTIGFTSKFGYCGIKVFIQYKANWPTIEQQREKRFLEIKHPQSETIIPTTLEHSTNTKLHTHPIEFKENSKRYTRLLQNLFAKNKIPYYYND